MPYADGKKFVVINFSVVLVNYSGVELIAKIDFQTGALLGRGRGVNRQGSLIDTVVSRHRSGLEINEYDLKFG